MKRKREKRLKVEKGKKAEQEKRRKLEANEIAGLTQVRGVYHRLTGIMG